MISAFCVASIDLSFGCCVVCRLRFFNSVLGSRGVLFRLFFLFVGGCDLLLSMAPFFPLQVGAGLFCHRHIFSPCHLGLHSRSLIERRRRATQHGREIPPTSPSGHDFLSGVRLSGNRCRNSESPETVNFRVIIV